MFIVSCIRTSCGETSLGSSTFSPPVLHLRQLVGPQTTPGDSTVFRCASCQVGRVLSVSLQQKCVLCSRLYRNSRCGCNADLESSNFTASAWLVLRVVCVSYYDTYSLCDFVNLLCYFVTYFVTCLFACMLARLLACTIAHLLACMLAQLHACTLARLHACTIARLHTCSHARLLACTIARLHNCSLACLHACSLARLLDCSLARLHT